MPKFNLADVETSKPTSFERHVWPDGWYRVMFSNVDYLPTKKGDGKCLHVKELCVERGDHFQDHLMEFLTLEHPNSVVENIARARLKEIAIACDLDPDDVDTDDLEGKIIMIRVYAEPEENEKYADVDGLANKVGEYKSIADYTAAAKGSTRGSMDATTALSSGKKSKPPKKPAADDVPF